ncbi:hypothetical protein Hanom_Chr15g01385801 [Helianthus anomalus]
MCTGDRITHVNTKLWHKIKFGDGAKLKVLQWEAGFQVGEGGSRQYEGPRQSDYSWGVFENDMQARVHSSQPPEYVGWET